MKEKITIKTERKRKSSILDKYRDEIKELVDIGLNPVAISKIINNKIGVVSLSVNAYRHYIKTRL